MSPLTQGDQQVVGIDSGAHHGGDGLYGAVHGGGDLDLHLHGLQNHQQGAAFKRKEEMHRMAEANKAFAHFRF